jgi:hypothetical protein
MTDKALALKAYKVLCKTGEDGPALAKAIGVTYAKDAWKLAQLGSSWSRIDDAKLTKPERLLLTSLAAAHRYALIDGSTASPKGVFVSRIARKSSGWAAYVVAKRLGSHRKDEDEARRGTGLNFVEARRNGHMWLTPAGWAVVHAMEAAA